MPENDSILLFEGSYFYFQKESNYSQENFQLIQAKDQESYWIRSEILSRIETGEFLKIKVHYDLNNHFIPNHVKIEKSIGNKYACETFLMDLASQELHYTFLDSNQQLHEYKRPISSKHFVSSPAFATSVTFLLSKKLDALGRTPIVLVSSTNDWTYEGPPTEKVIYAEMKTREMQDFKINNSTLMASHLCLYEFDSSHTIVEQPVNIYISKHFSLPYQMTQGDQKIVIKNLKKHTID